MQDMVNRRISMDLMMRIANEQRARQFIFLTPLDMRYKLHLYFSPVFKIEWNLIKVNGDIKEYLGV